MFRKLQPFVFLAFLTLSQPVNADDLLIDGVPLPSDAAVAATTPGSAFQQWSGVWVGLWGGSLKHILLVESVSEDGAAHVIYAISENPYAGIQPRWLRREGIASGRTLKVTGQGFTATYEMAEDGSLKARFERGDNASSATMAKADLASLTRPDAVVAWTRGKSEFLQTDLIEDGKPVRLEVVIFRPSGAGPFPLAVINHGSTGRGVSPSLFTHTWFAPDLADFLNDRGWIVAFPQRRGRGKSDGLYDEGFAENRKLGYTGDTYTTFRGADRALSDIDAAITALRRRQDVAPTPVLLGGNSRGGVLSIAYAGLHPEQVAGVINFVGGWLGESSPAASTVNHQLFERGASYGRPTIWLYGQHDRFYSIAHSRDNFAAFEKAGGQGKFFEFDMPPGQGHSLIGRPNLWSGPLDSYLSSLAATGKD
ncbi:alpha/beta hydrolase [Bradyrhizobium sp. 200]|uniref:alpha/beta hydrolase family protein n=1 Tax=Bradyrhizobium sp. 200 TaxID=2782665 RepID=UPI00200029F8|nr:alpha/beta hydrolase [Bradyrhizobium sp. 200]UPJ51138.1 alpha/beta hydrolase [Bradyrhizobium sp. 200]